MKACDCNHVRLDDTRVSDVAVCGTYGALIHVECGGYVVCEFAYLLDNDEHPATTHHIDYFTCEKHETNAVDNVLSRTT